MPLRTRALEQVWQLLQRRSCRLQGGGSPCWRARGAAARRTPEWPARCPGAMSSSTPSLRTTAGGYLPPLDSRGKKALRWPRAEGASGCRLGSFCRCHDCKRGVSCSPAPRRYRICREHSAAPCLILEGTEQRFCRPCGCLHPMAEFIGEGRVAPPPPPGLCL